MLTLQGRCFQNLRLAASMICFDDSLLFSPKIGLAVDDIKGVQDQAVLERQAMLVRIKPGAL